MTWLNGLSKEDIQDMEDDAKVAFHTGVITEKEFRETLAKLGNNATDIQELVDFYTPPPPENDNAD